MPRGEGGPGAKAKAQKLVAQHEKEDAAAKKKEARVAAQWEDGANQRAIARQKEQEAKEAAKEAAKAAKKAAEEADAADLSKMRAPAGKARKAASQKKKKNDMSLLDAYLADEKKTKAKKAAVKAAQQGITTESDQNDLLKPNLNRERAAAAAEGHVEASGLDDALAALDVGGKPNEKGPSRKAAYMAFEEAAMARLKEEYPTLKRSQLKDKIWKEWQKAPENPENQQQLQQPK